MLVSKLLLLLREVARFRQREPFVNRKHIVLTFISILWFVLFIIALKNGIIPFIGKGINFKRNLNFTTEPTEVDELLDSIHKHSAHRSRPVKNKNHTVILAIRQHSHFLKDVIRILISMKLRSIKNTSLRLTSTSVSVSRLTTLKLLNKIVNLLLRRFLEVIEVRINSFEDVTPLLSTLLSKFFPVFTNIILKFIVVNNLLC